MDMKVTIRIHHMTHRRDATSAVDWQQVLFLWVTMLLQR